VALIGFVLVPNSNEDWASNWDTTRAVLHAAGGVIIWLGLIVGGCALLAKVRVRKGRAATPTLPERAIVTVGSAAGAFVKYLIGPFTRFWVGLNREAVAPLIDSLRSENTEQHAETSHRLAALEERVRELSVWRDKADAIMRPSEAIEALVGQMQDMANIVQGDRRTTEDRIEALDRRIQRLMTLLMDRRVE
jgi:hypothetical protein